MPGFEEVYEKIVQIPADGILEEGLDLSNHGLADEGLMAFAERCQRINKKFSTKSIDLSGNQLTNLDGLNKLGLSVNFDSVQILNLANNSLNNFNLDFLVRFKKITELNLSGNSIDDKSLSASSMHIASALSKRDNKNEPVVINLARNKLSNINALLQFVSMFVRKQNIQLILNENDLSVKNEEIISNRDFENLTEKLANNFTSCSLKNCNLPKSIPEKIIGVVKEKKENESIKKYQSLQGDRLPLLVSPTIIEIKKYGSLSNSDLQLDINNLNSYNKLIREITRGSASRFLLYGLLKYGNNSLAIAINNEEFVSDKLSRHLLSGNAIPLPSQKLISPLITTQLGSSFSNLYGTLWPLLFYSLYSHDIAQYINKPGSRFGYGWSDLLAGAAYNSQNLTTYLARTAVNDNAANMTFVLSLSAPLILSLYNTVRRLNWRKPWTEEAVNEFVAQEKTGLLNLLASLDKAAWGLQWHESLDQTQREQIRQKFFNTVEHGSIIPAITALNYLADFINNPRSEDMAIILPNRTEEFLKFREQTFCYLTIIAQGNIEIPRVKKIILQFTAQYLIWTLGQERNLWRNIFFSTMALSSLLLKTFALYQLVHAWVIRIEKYVHYFVERYECHDKGNFYRYMREFDEFMCVTCPDYPIYFGDKFEAQQCLNGLLTQQTDPSIILQLLSTLQTNKILNKLDLSHTEWPYWNANQWDNFCNQIDRLSFADQAILNLSQSVYGQYEVSLEQLMHITAPFKNSLSSTIDLTNLDVHPPVLLNWLTQMPNNSIGNLILSGNSLENSLLKPLFEEIHRVGAESVKMANNSLNGQAATIISQQQKNSPIKFFDLSGNNFPQAGVDSLADGLEGLQELDLSNINLSKIDLRKFMSGVKNSSLKILRLSNCSIHSQQIIEIVNEIAEAKNLRVLDLSNNHLGDEGTVVLISSLVRNKTLEELNISNNQISNTGIENFSPDLKNTSIIRLDISGNIFLESGMQAFTLSIAEMSLTDLNLSGCHIDDNLLIILSGGLERMQVLAQILLGNNFITANSVQRFIKAIEHLSLLGMDLQGNDLQILGTNSITTWLKTKPSLKYLNLKNNRIPAMGIIPFADVLPTTNIDTLILDKNPLGDSGGIYLALKLVSPTPAPQQLANKKVGIDEKHALIHAKANTNITKISICQTGITKATAETLCHLLPKTNITFDSLNFEGNVINDHDLNINTCQTSSATRLSPFNFVKQTFEFCQQGMRWLSHEMSESRESCNVTNSLNLINDKGQSSSFDYSFKSLWIFVLPALSYYAANSLFSSNKKSSENMLEEDYYLLQQFREKYQEHVRNYRSLLRSSYYQEHIYSDIILKSYKNGINAFKNKITQIATLNTFSFNDQQKLLKNYLVLNSRLQKCNDEIADYESYLDKIQLELSQSNLDLNGIKISKNSNTGDFRYQVLTPSELWDLKELSDERQQKAKWQFELFNADKKPKLLPDVVVDNIDAVDVNNLQQQALTKI